MAVEQIVVRDGDRELGFSFADMLAFHAGDSPGGVAHAFKVMQRGFPLLDDGQPPQRHELSVLTAFGGPGARDAFECVSGAVSSGRYEVDPGVARPELGRARARFVFRLTTRTRSVTLLLREGFVTEEFIDLAGREARNAEEESHLSMLKAEMAGRVMAAEAAAVYELVPGA